MNGLPPQGVTALHVTQICSSPFILISSKYKINTPDQHAHGQDMPDQEPNNPPMVLQHPMFIGHQTTGLDRKGGPNGRDENSTTTTHILDE
jgi:hypothetical protein